MKRILPVSNLVALIVTIVVNYISNTKLLNGATVASVSRRLPTLVTPAPYAFLIWSIIYLGLLVFAIYHLRRTKEASEGVRQVGWWFVGSCIVNSCWIFAWIYGYIGLSVVLMFVLLGCLISILIRTKMELTDAPRKTIFFLWWPFCLYIGWITMAAAVNVSAWLVSAGWDGMGIDGKVWAIGVVVFATVIYLLLTWLRNMREAALVGVWALIAVGVADLKDAPTVSYVAWLMSAVLLVSASIHGYRNRKTSPFHGNDFLAGRDDR